MLNSSGNLRRFEAAPPGVPLPALTAIASSPLVMTLSSTSTLMQKSGSSPSVLPRQRGEAGLVIEDWRQHYNKERPHSRLGYLSPEDDIKQQKVSP